MTTNTQATRDLGITPETRARLVRVVGALVADCLRFYEDDLDIIDWLVEAAN